ncbi:unnamed protein product [Schistocephalus solidus]|uniref:Uncharacterized protein n=1 Tax=Schistocephalus solidus TaxID=70667 RepID=A0A183T0X8_SCHSO|nr:unnamed protein product [Schistocephalus solidus]
MLLRMCHLPIAIHRLQAVRHFGADIFGPSALSPARRIDSGHNSEYSGPRWQIHVLPTPESLDYGHPQDGFAPTLLSPTSAVSPEVAPKLRLRHLVQAQQPQQTKACQPEAPSPGKADSDNSSISEYSNVVIISKAPSDVQSAPQSKALLPEDASPHGANSLDGSHGLTLPGQPKPRHVTDRLRVEEQDEIATVSVTSGSPYG